jgi:murein DD-endopeptidase MepM/ murein hydrolase activator NlpD
MGRIKFFGGKELALPGFDEDVNFFEVSIVMMATKKCTVRMRILFFFFLFIANAVTGHGQMFAPAAYPQGYFSNPLNIPISLAGNFGELRPNHYHMGFDLKTNHRENLPVHAAAGGYIARIKIEPFGFGRAIYINHPNGFTTVYGHLNAFIPALEAWLKEQQYQQQSWKVFLELPPNLFPVKKGDLIAYSGNTGGSQGPHLHFEIRSTAGDINKNPMLFGLPLADNTRPTISRLAVYNRQLSLYEQSPKLIPIKKTTGGYSSAAAVVKPGSAKISLAISASDTHSGSVNPNGIFEADLYDNDKPVIGFRMDDISYDNTRNINAHIDYKTRATGGPFLQQLFELPGYTNSIYRRAGGDGTIDLSDGVIHIIKIYVKDGYNNTSVLQTKLQYTGVSSALSVATGKKFFPLMVDGWEGPDCEFYIGDHSLYDSVHINYRREVSIATGVVSAVHTIGAKWIPLADPMTVRIRPTALLDSAKRGHTVMQRVTGTKHEVQRVEWQKGWAAARFREMGDFQLVLDETAPVIVPVGFSDGANMSKASRLVFLIKDNLDEIRNFRAELDGKWLRFSNDKGRNFIYIFDEKCGPGAHSLKIIAEDAAGNLASKMFNFSR